MPSETPDESTVKLPKADHHGPLVSIITPTYNHERFIGACVSSVLQQAYRFWEQVVIDDGSTDNTAHVVSTFRDSRIRFQCQANRGPFELARTYNRALSQAKGELIAILEGDDFWPPAKLATLVPAFADPEVILAYGEVADVDARGLEQRNQSHTTRLRRRLPASVLFNDPVGTATLYMLLAEGRSLVSPSTVIIRRSALERIGGFQYVTGLPLTDYPTFIELSLLGKFYYSARTMGYRRRHQDSITVNHAQTIHRTVSDFTISFLDKHRDDVTISPYERKKIQQNWQASRGKLHFSEGRFLLLQSKWSEARYQFTTALKSRNPKVRIAALVGWLSSWFHLDIEPLMKLAGRAKLRTEQRSLQSSPQEIT